MSIIDAAYKEIYGETDSTTQKEFGLDVLARAVLDEFTPNIYGGTTDYRAIVLTNAVPVPPEAHIITAGVNLGLPSPYSGDTNYAHWVCRCRIVENGSPHEIIPPPNSLIDPTPADAEIIGQHPFFVTKDALTEVDAPQVGDVVYVSYEKGPEGGRQFKGLILTKPYLTNGAAGGFDVSGQGPGFPLMRDPALKIPDEWAGQPIAGGGIGSGFGLRKDPFTGKTKGHGGADYPHPVGTPVYAIADGTIKGGPVTHCKDVAKGGGVKTCGGGFGNNIKILHRAGGGNKVISTYAHLSAIAPGIADGAAVTKGQLIGQVGNTGRSTGPHLHLEVSIDGKQVNPATYINENSTKPEATVPSEEMVVTPDEPTASESEAMDELGVVDG